MHKRHKYYKRKQKYSKEESTHAVNVAVNPSLNIECVLRQLNRGKDVQVLGLQKHCTCCRSIDLKSDIERDYVEIAINAPWLSISETKVLSIIPFLGSRGFCASRSFSGFSIPIAIAGSESVSS